MEGNAPLRVLVWRGVGRRHIHGHCRPHVHWHHDVSCRLRVHVRWVGVHAWGTEPPGALWWWPCGIAISQKLHLPSWQVQLKKKKSFETHTALASSSANWIAHAKRQTRRDGAGERMATVLST